MAIWEEFNNKLCKAINNRYSIIFVETIDYAEIDFQLGEIFKKKNVKSCAHWSTNGWKLQYGNSIFERSSGMLLYDVIVEYLFQSEIDGANFLVLKGIEDTAMFPELESFLFSFMQKNDNINDISKKSMVFFVSPTYPFSPGLNSFIYRLKLPRPDLEDIKRELNVPKAHIDQSQNKYKYSREFINNYQKNENDLISALYGLQMCDIRKIMNDIANDNENRKIHLDLPGKNLNQISQRKKELVNNSGLLEVIDNYNEIHVGNISALQEYLETQRFIIKNSCNYSIRIPKPKGILLIGPPGCGKSETSKMIAKKLDLALFRLDIGRLLGQYVGVSEHNLIDAIKTAEAAQPCVLWIDEIEKAFSGSGENGNDVTITRMLGYFLTWMQDRTSSVYLVATANNLDALRPEFLRKGRWDEIFYLSYPHKEGAKEIFEACLMRYGLECTDNNKLDPLCSDIAKYELSGADIDSLIRFAYNEEFIRFKGEKKIKTIQLSDLNKELQTLYESKKKNQLSEKEKKITENLRDMKIHFLENRKYKIDHRFDEKIKELLKMKIEIDREINIGKAQEDKPRFIEEKINEFKLSSLNNSSYKFDEFKLRDELGEQLIKSNAHFESTINKRLEAYFIDYQIGELQIQQIKYPDEDITEILYEKYKRKSREELESEYKSKGYKSASKSSIY